MNLNWLQKNLIYLTVHGSRAYGMATESSDLDIKGIVIPPQEIEYALFEHFDQSENNVEISMMVDYLKNPLNPKIESCVYSLRKFFILAAEVNPNIIELLWTDPSDHIKLSPTMNELIDNRKLFLSNKARWTWSGYAFAQAKKIERHRKWIVQGELTPPSRGEFGLPAIPPRGIDGIFGHIKSKVEQWNLNQFPLDEMVRAELKQTIWDLLTSLTEKEYSIANWPDKYADGVIYTMKRELNLKDEVIDLIYAERAYYKAKSTYDSWLHWKSERNPSRKILEEKYGYDCKHASQLVRLMRMGYEIITEGKVIVKRPDADELLAIKNGAWSFGKVMEFKDIMENKLDEEYARQKKLIEMGDPVPLPREVNKEALTKLYHRLYENYWGTI